jgi:NodT family efflux transporter outer membrane factor (OMF) lipoprotein
MYAFAVGRPSHLLHALPLLLALTLVGCASVLPQRAEAPLAAVPAAWSTASQTTPQITGQQPADLSGWWQRFNDPVLTDLVARSLRANTSLQSAQASLRQARALADAQAAGLGPSLGVSASAQRSQAGNASAGSRFQAGFDASWEPDIFGRNRSAANASVADALASAANLGNVQVSLAAEVAVNYINLRALQTRLAIARDNLATQQETLQITRWRAQAGLVSSLDLEQAISASAQTEAQLPALQTGVTQTLNALAVLTGQAPGALGAVLDTAAAIPTAPADLAMAFPAETLRQRPDVRAAERRIDAALSRLSAAEAARYPSFRLGGSLGLSAFTLGSLTDSASVLRSLLASVSAPLFDGGALQAQARAQQAGVDQTRAAYQGTVLTALQEVEDALAALRGDTERLARLQTASTAAANADLLARQRYQSGLISFDTVLSTQRSLLATQDGVASTRGSLSTNHVRLYKALGGGWQPNAGLGIGGQPGAGAAPAAPSTTAAR